MGWQKPEMAQKETHGASQFSMLGDDEKGNPLTSDKVSDWVAGEYTRYTV